MAKAPLKRCAVYTRKSSEEGLEQDFNSLQAQREACEAFIKSQRSEGWQLIETPYDDGGISGGTMERPALQRLLADIGAGKVDVVVVYKVDRLTRALADFAKMVELFDARGVSFVAVTQQFNTTTSMGRLTLNVLLSFAQFEREVTGERIRDKIAASKRKGMWMGGNVPLGYDAYERKLVVNASEAETVRLIFKLYDSIGNVRELQKELDRRGMRAKYRIDETGKRVQGCRFSRGALYRILGNPVYIGQIRHKEVTHQGLHEAILEERLWRTTQEKLAALDMRSGQPRKTSTSSLIGKLFDETGRCLTPTHAVKNGRRYRYYYSPALLKGESQQSQGWRLPALEIERTVAREAATLLGDHTKVAHGLKEAGAEAQHLTAGLNEAKDLAARLGGEPADIALVGAAVRRVDLRPDGFTLVLGVTLSGFAVELSRKVELQMKRRGNELRLVVPGAHRASKADPALLKALARAHRWFREVMAGKSLRGIAEADGIGPVYVSRVLPLAFLAPSITEAIIRGEQPAGLTAQQLLARTRLHPDWQRQRRALGFTD